MGAEGREFAPIVLKQVLSSIHHRIVAQLARLVLRG